LSNNDSIARFGLEIEMVMVTKTKKEPRPNRTKSSSKAVAEPAPEPSTKPGADISSPTAETLAIIAANVSKGVDLDPRLAVDYAFKLWKSAREKLAGDIREPAPAPKEPAPAPKEPAPVPREPAPVPREPAPVPKEAAPVPRADETIPKSDGGGRLPTFPATFDTFLGMVVNGKTLADSTQRFREYLRSNSATEAEADKRLANLAGEGFKDSKSWRVTALEYREWWESHESQPAGKPAKSSVSASTPAESPVPPPKAALPTFDTFLRTVVKGDSDADSEKRFCAFLRSKFPEPQADELMARLSKEGFKDIGSWLETAREYRDWRKSEKSS
jgi:hypothetical protein